MTDLNIIYNGNLFYIKLDTDEKQVLSIFDNEYLGLNLNRQAFDLILEDLGPDLVYCEDDPGVTNYMYLNIKPEELKNNPEKDKTKNLTYSTYKAIYISNENSDAEHLNYRSFVENDPNGECLCNYSNVSVCVPIIEIYNMVLVQRNLHFCSFLIKLDFENDSNMFPLRFFKLKNQSPDSKNLIV